LLFIVGFNGWSLSAIVLLIVFVTLEVSFVSNLSYCRYKSTKIVFVTLEVSFVSNLSYCRYKSTKNDGNWSIDNFVTQKKRKKRSNQINQVYVNQNTMIVQWR
jgi:hypothetical protein